VLAITHVTVIDAAGAGARPDQTVVIRDGRIAALGKSAAVVVPAGAEVVDGTDKFLIPGLWDMHAHIAAVSPAGAQAFLDLYLANGVTGVREMHAFFPDLIFSLRKEVEAGKRIGPRIVAAGAMIDGPNPSAGGAIPAADGQQGRAAVQALKKRGADFIKVHSKLPRDAYFAIADEARKQGLAFAGHVPESVSAAEASDAGQKSIEHMTGLWLSCSTEEQALRKETTEALRSGQAGDLGLLIRLWLKPVDSYSEPKARALYQRFAKNRTWQTPTLVLVRAVASLDDPAFTADRRVRFMPTSLRSFWDPKNPQYQAMTKGLVNLKPAFKRSLEEVGKMHRAGVELLAGTDTPFPFCFPGFSVHDELALLVEAGLTPMQALQAATRNPARYLGRLDDLGTVEKGKIADLVLLDANPLDAIKNTQRIAAVVVRGKLLSQDALRKMLADLQQPPPAKK
jgi:imidazolonepropionase-like amidohydrolase